MLALIRLFLLIGVLLGYMNYLYSQKIEIAFTPVLVISGISLVMYFAGLFNCMLYALVIIVAGGYFCGFLGVKILIKDTFSKKKTSFSEMSENDVNFV